MALALDVAMLRGELRAPPRRSSRIVALLDAPRSAEKERIRQKNASYRAKFKQRAAADPALLTARAQYFAAWRQKHADRVQAARDRWNSENPDFHRVYSRVWMRTKRDRARSGAA